MMLSLRQKVLDVYSNNLVIEVAFGSSYWANERKGKELYLASLFSVKAH